MWATLTRAWCTTETVARDLVAVAERRGYLVDIESYVTLKVETKKADPAGDSDPGQGLW